MESEPPGNYRKYLRFTFVVFLVISIVIPVAEYNIWQKSGHLEVRALLFIFLSWIGLAYFLFAYKRAK